MKVKIRYHYLYKTTNMVNGKYYYGIHSTYNINDGYFGSGKYLKRSIEKYGRDNFKIEIISYHESREDLLKAEKDFITEEIISDDMCMNLRPGGTGGFSSEQQRINAIKSNIKQSELRNDPDYMKRFCDKISKSQKMLYDNGIREKFYFYDWTGKSHKEESKKIIGEKNSKHQQGTGNSQYGTCWITKDGENKKIKNENLKEYIELGWNKGRKIHGDNNR